MAKQKNTQRISEGIFPNALGAFERYHNLRDADPYLNKREKYMLSYSRKPWKRGGKNAKDKLDPNFGQFRSKIDTAIGTFTETLSERSLNVKIVPKYCKKTEVKKLSRAISTAFHRLFIKPWEERFIIDCDAVFDMVMEGKAIEHWPTASCVYSEYVPVCYVFPDSNAGPDPKKWDYCFIQRDFSLASLEKMLSDSKERDSTIPDSDDEDCEIIFKTNYLQEIVDNPSTFAKTSSTKRSDIRNQGEISSGSKDFTIPIVYLYIKEDYSHESPVSLYCFPAEYVKTSNSQSTENDKAKSNIKYLFAKKNYAKCISNHIVNRYYQITRNWWTCNSFAEQIYLCCALYDKSMSLVLRAVKRNSILYFASDSASTVQKMLNQNDDEVQHVAAGVQYITTGQNSNVREVIESTRQIMIDTENGQSLAQAPGSQNVKGYAITAEEARIRSMDQSAAQTLNIKMLMCADVFLWKEIYRRAMNGDDPKFDKSIKAFKEEMEDMNIDSDLYDFENLYFEPSFINGGSQSARIANASGAAAALAVDPKNSGQEQAQRDLIAAYVGNDNVDSYIEEKTKILPSQLKAGGENEDLDNAYVNPKNVPVLPDDLHMQEIPIHLMDYELKLTVAEKLMQRADGSNNPVKKILYLSMAEELIKAQDNKGAHINAHLQMVENNKLNKVALSEILPRYQAVQQKQDQMVAGIEKVLAALDEQMATSSFNDEKTRHLSEMNQLTETHAKTMMEIEQEKALQKRQAGIDKAADAREANLEKVGIDLAAKEAETSIKLTQQENATITKFKQDEADLAAKRAKSDSKAATSN